MFVTRRAACVLWKLEGDISVSEREIPSEFEWWDTARAQRAKEDLLHSEHRRAPRARVQRAIEKKQLCVLLHLECLKFAMHTAHVLAGTRTFYPVGQKIAEGEVQQE